MISLPVHRKISGADEEEWFMAVMEEANEMFMAHRDWLRKGGLKSEVTSVTAEGQHLRKEIADLFLVSFGYLVYHSDKSREEAEDFILQVVLDNVKRGKYSKETYAEISEEIIKSKGKEELISNFTEILNTLR